MILMFGGQHGHKARIYTVAAYDRGRSLDGKLGPPWLPLSCQYKNLLLYLVFRPHLKVLLYVCVCICMILMFGGHGHKARIYAVAASDRGRSLVSSSSVL